MRRVSSRSRSQCRGMCSSTSMKPITASFSTCSTSSTPAAFISSPPIPLSRNGAFRAFSSRATPEAWRSPDTSPATNRISRTARCHRSSGKRGERTLDVAHDGQRNRQRFTSVFTRDRNWCVARDRLDECLELEPQWLALQRVERNAFDEGLERLCALCVAHERKEVDVATQAIEFSRAGGEI